MTRSLATRPIEKMRDAELHKPVLVNEVIAHLRLKRGYTVLDATLGCAGHARLILDIIKPDGRLIGIDRDAKALREASDRLVQYKDIITLVQGNFCDIDLILDECGVRKLDAALFDLGISSFQLGDSTRGFSFEREGFLDMRMDQTKGLSAFDVVNKYSKSELERVIRELGEERHYRKIVRRIVDEREKCPIRRTTELSDLIKRTVGRYYRKERIHPATRTFQALRIEVNKELKNIDKVLENITSVLKPGGRIVVISFHSLEDRIVKHRFRDLGKKGEGRVITKKPIIAEDTEKKNNPRSRSAKLRVFEKND